MEKTEMEKTEMENTERIRHLFEAVANENENECVLCGKPMVPGWPVCPGCAAPTKEEGELPQGEIL
jgi:uncharacterized OB-fold protein